MFFCETFQLYRSGYRSMSVVIEIIEKLKLIILISTATWYTNPAHNAIRISYEKLHKKMSL